jgi:hypothetical protein
MKRHKKLVTKSFHYCQSLLNENGIGFWPICKIIHSNQEVSVSLVALWEGPCYINSKPTLYWCIWPQFPVRRPWLAAQVSHCQHHFSTSLLTWGQKNLYRILFRVLLTPKWPPDSPLCSSVSTSFILLQERIIWAIWNRPLADSQLCSSMQLLTASNFHWAQHVF